MQRFAKYYREYVDVVVRTFPELKLKKSRFTYSGIKERERRRGREGEGEGEKKRGREGE